MQNRIGFKMAAEFENANVANEEEEMETDDDSDDTSSSEDDSPDIDPAKEAEIRELLKEISINPYGYDAHVKVIGLLRAAGDLERLRQSRESMGKTFPLTEALWLEWLQDEIKLAESGEEKDSVISLFERAFKDYISVGVWLEYVQFSVGFMGDEGGMQRVRDSFERALTAVGLHVSQGSAIWEAYREFENAVLLGLQPGSGAVPSTEQQDLIASQSSRVAKIFKRQLSVPLLNMESTLEEYKTYSGEDEGSVSDDVKLVYQRATAQLSSIQEMEDKLITSDPPHTEVYREYLSQEMSRGEPARIQCLFERAIQDNCLEPEFWLQYTKYLDMELCSFELSVSVHQRAVRNCPWCVELWLSFMRAQERNGDRHRQINETFEKAISVGYSQGSDYLQLWTGYCDFLRRRIYWDEDDKSKAVDELRAAFDKAITYLNQGFPEDGDPNCTLLQYWARIEAKYCDNMEKARDLWNTIMQAGFGNQANMWLEYFNLERAYGDHKHCRKVLQKALNSVNDWPEGICEAYKNFEREEGTLEQYDQALVRIDAQMRRIYERRKQAEEKESKKVKAPPKGKRVSNKAGQTQGTQEPSPKWQSLQQSVPLSVTSRQAQHKPSAAKRKVEEDAASTDADGFKVPGLPSPAKAPNKSAPPGFKPKTADSAELSQKKAPPPGYKPSERGDNAEPPVKKAKVADVAAGDSSSQQTSGEDSCTVFVSNLSYTADESIIRQAFMLIGDLKEIRIIKNYKGQSKGYAYVEFRDELSAQKALALDRQPIEGRPMFVSECNRKKSDPEGKFKFSTDLEKSKLFVKNLPFTVTKEALENIFKQHGELKDVRLVTYRSGASKGLAYVEYMDEAMAAQALLKTDGLQIGEHTISVAISNPPPRKAPVTQRETKEFTPSLGGGKKDTAAHGKAHTQISLMPRALQRKPSSTSKPTASLSSTSASAASSKSDDSAQSDQSACTGSKMSNADFRNMLLNK